MLNEALLQLEKDGSINKEDVEATPHGKGKKYKITEVGREHLKTMDNQYRNTKIEMSAAEGVLAACLGTDDLNFKPILDAMWSKVRLV